MSTKETRKRTPTTRLMDSNVIQRIRTAIALTALSHKPPEQSISCLLVRIAYILDLKARFPTSRCVTEVREDDPWRIRALALEEENEKLRVNVQKHELQILALKAAPTTTEDPNTQPESSQAPKKKKKVVPSASKTAPNRLDLRTLIKDIRSGPRLPVLRDSLDVLTSFRTVRLLDEQPALETGQETILIPNVKRSLLALGKLLSAVIARDGSVVAASSRLDVTNCLCDLLLTLLNSTLPLAPRETIMPHIIGDLTIYIVRPIVRAFHTLSVREITCGIKENYRKKNDVDIRPDLMSILQRLIECVRLLKARTRDLREFMVFETATEIEALWNTTRWDREPSREQRIEILARKDSLWYQCSVLHAALDRFPSFRTREGEESVLCSEGIRVLADLVKHFERGSPVDEVAKNMVLGVLEKAWLSGLYEQSPNEET